jgi:polysaccharide biosynthesis protein PelA
MSGGEIACYYGTGQLDRLAEYQRVVLQAEAYPPEDLHWLREQGVQTLGYLSLTEDTGPDAPWQRDEHNADWGGAFVQVDHPEWVAHVVGQGKAALGRGFAGLFLDALNIELTFPEQVPHLLALVAALREATRPAYLLANRGFGLLPWLGELVEGVLFESFSAHWTTDGGYEPWPPDTLEVHARYAERLGKFDLDVFALDYADSQGLTEFAMRRARQFGMACFVSNRELSRV